MNLRSKLASGALMAATAAVVMTTAMAVPGVSSAQPYYDDDGYAAQQACQQQQHDRAVGGAILGGLAGAAIGNGVSHGGARTGGTIVGGVAGAAVGAGVGASTTNCADYPAAPPPGYRGGPGYYDNGYYDRDRDADRGQCGWATRQITYPDGASTRDSVRSCRDEDGRWRLVP